MPEARILVSFLPEVKECAPAAAHPSKRLTGCQLIWFGYIGLHSSHKNYAGLMRDELQLNALVYGLTLEDQSGLYPRLHP